MPHFADSPDFRERFKREARVAAQIDSDYIVDVFDAGVDDATQMPFLAMELLRGEELARTLKRVVRMAPGRRRHLPSPDFARSRSDAQGVDRSSRSRSQRTSSSASETTVRRKSRCSTSALPSSPARPREAPVRPPTASAPRSTWRPSNILPGAEVTPAADIYALGLLAYTLLVGTDYWHEELERDDNVFAFALIAMKGPVELPSARAHARGARAAVARLR